MSLATRACNARHYMLHCICSSIRCHFKIFVDTLIAGEFFDELHDFISTVDWDLIFDVNLLYRTNDRWDPSNARELMKYTVKRGYRVAAWELGNGRGRSDHF